MMGEAGSEPLEKQLEVGAGCKSWCRWIVPVPIRYVRRHHTYLPSLPGTVVDCPLLVHASSVYIRAIVEVAPFFVKYGTVRYRYGASTRYSRSAARYSTIPVPHRNAALLELQHCYFLHTRYDTYRYYYLALRPPPPKPYFNIASL